jgi:hypothetical protein
VFGAPLDNIKIIFCYVQYYFSGEFFVPLEGEGQVCLILCIIIVIYEINYTTLDIKPLFFFNNQNEKRS